MPALKIKRLHKHWGSCGPGRLVTLNLELIKAPKDCPRARLVQRIRYGFALTAPNASAAFTSTGLIQPSRLSLRCSP
jgi:hypothetical protein